MVDHRQDQLGARLAEPLAQLPAGVAPGFDQRARIPERGALLHPERQRLLVLVAVLDDGRSEVDIGGGDLGQVDKQEVHTGEVAPLAIPAGVPGNAEEGEVATAHVLKAFGDPVAIDHIEVGIDHQGVAGLDPPDRHVEGGGMVVAAAAGQGQGLRIDAGQHLAAGIVQHQLWLAPGGVVDHQQAEVDAGIERVDHLQLPTDIVVVLLDADGQDGEAGQVGHAHPRVFFGGGPSSAGSNNRAQTRVQTIEIIRILPMLAVPG